MTTLAPRYKNLNGSPQGVLTSGIELSTLIASIGSEASELIINQNVVVTANTTTPSTLTIRVINGSLISIANGVTLTINGYFDCGLYQAFAYTGTGRVKFATGSIQQVYPEWYVADLTVASLAMQYAYDSLPDNGGCIYITRSVYMSATLLCNVTLKIITIRGSSVFKADLRYDGAGGVISLQDGADATLENFSLNMAASADSKGITIDGCYRVIMNRISMTTRGLTLTSTQTFPTQGYNGVYWCTFTNVKANWIVLAADNAGGGINANTFISCTTVGFHPILLAGCYLGGASGDGSNSNTFIGCDFSYGSSAGSVYAVLVGLYADHNTFIGTYIENADKAIYNRGYDTSFIGGQINGTLAIDQAAQGNFSIFTISNQSRQKSVATSAVSAANTWTIADDTAISFTDINDISLISIISGLPANSGILHIFPGNNECTTLSVGANIQASGVALSGTTGVDGKLTISGNGGLTYIENRTGVSVTLSTITQGIPANVS